MTPLLPRYRKYPASVHDKVVAEGRCRMCQRGWDVRPPTRHHLVPLCEKRRVTRINDPRNIVPLCRPCHDLIDNRSPVQRIARAMLRSLLHLEEAEFVAAWMGSGWLLARYPRHTVDADQRAALLHIRG